VPEVDLVRVHRQDLFLRVAPLDLEGHESFVDLPGDGLARRQEDGAGELLRQGRATLREALLSHVGEQGGDGALEVHAPVPEEVLVLGRDDRVPQHRRDLAPRDEDPPFDGVPRDRGTVGPADLSDDVGSVGLELRDARNPDEARGGRSRDSAEERRGEERHHGDEDFSAVHRHRFPF
jgi:hypothetical protein